MLFQCNLERLNLWNVDSDKLSPHANLGISVFNSIKKGVDALHIKNHVRKECRENYPEIVKELRENFVKPNTESAEQTFVWLSKFKKIMNSMSKENTYFICTVL